MSDLPGPLKGRLALLPISSAGLGFGRKTGAPAAFHLAKAWMLTERNLAALPAIART